MGEIDADYIHYCYGSDAQKLSVVLEKHPEHGLGLTLVDGSVNGVHGVYVKSVAAGVDSRNVLNVGDCLLKINGISLFNKSRHDAVELVKQAQRKVELEVLRFPSITEVLASSKNSNKTVESPIIEDTRKSSKDSGLPQRSRTPPGITTIAATDRRSSNATAAVLDRTSSQNKKTGQRRQRAVSDFGAIGDLLPVLNTEDLLIGAMGSGTRSRTYRRR